MSKRPLIHDASTIKERFILYDNFLSSDRKDFSGFYSRQNTDKKDSFEFFLSLYMNCFIQRLEKNMTSKLVQSVWCLSIRYSSFEDLFQFVRLSFDLICNGTSMILYFKSEEQAIFHLKFLIDLAGWLRTWLENSFSVLVNCLLIVVSKQKDEWFFMNLSP